MSPILNKSTQGGTFCWLKSMESLVKIGKGPKLIGWPNAKVLRQYFPKYSLHFCHGQDPEDWPWPSGNLFQVGNQAWHEAKKSCHMINIPWTLKTFTDVEPPILWQLWGLMRGAPDFRVGGYDWWTILTIKKPINFVALLTLNITRTIIKESPLPPNLPYPPRPL